MAGNFQIMTERLIIAEFDERMAESVHLNSLDEDNRKYVPDEVSKRWKKRKRRFASLWNVTKAQKGHLSISAAYER